MTQYIISQSCIIMGYILSVICANIYALLYSMSLYYIAWMITLVGITIMIFGSLANYDMYSKMPIKYWLYDIIVGALIINTASIAVTVILYNYTYN